MKGSQGGASRSRFGAELRRPGSVASPLVGPADLIEAWGSVRPEDRAAVAELLGYRPVPSPRLGRVEVSPPPRPPEPKSPEPPPIHLGPKLSWEPVPLLQSVEVTYLGQPERVGPDAAPVAFGPAPARWLGQPLPEAKGRWRPGALQNAVYEIATRVVADGEPDIERWIGHLAEGRHLGTLPRKRVRRPVSVLHLHLDRDAQLAPSRVDGEQLRRALVGQTLPSALRTNGREAPRPGERSVVVSDAGTERSLRTEQTPASVVAMDSGRRWTKRAAQWRAEGGEAYLWLTGTMHRLPASERRSWSRVFAEPQPAALVAAEEVDRLLALASLALQVEADLLRELRVLISSDARLEQEAWLSEAVFDFGTLIVAQWKPEAFRRAREKLIRATLNDQRFDPLLLEEAMRAVARYRWAPPPEPPAEAAGIPFGKGAVEQADKAAADLKRAWWVNETLWQDEVGSWRGLLPHLPKAHENHLSAWLEDEGWPEDNDEFLKGMQSAVAYGHGRYSKADFERWLRQVQAFEPPELLQEGGIYHGVAEAIVESAPSAPVEIGFGPRGVELGGGASLLLSLPSLPNASIRVQGLGPDVELRLGGAAGPIFLPEPPGRHSAPQPSPEVGWADRAGRDGFGHWAEVDIEGVTVRFRWVPAGTFWMGSPDSDEEAHSDEKPRHPVTLTEGFWMADAPCTQALWAVVMGDNPSEFSKGREAPDRPVERVSWEDAVRFLERCEALRPGLGLRLPTEAQWEYACRAGSDEPRYGSLDAIAWHDGNSGNRTHPVKQKAPNRWGLHDMLGNVWEWCTDWYGPYGMGHAMDPMGPMKGSDRVLRGGSWGLVARGVRAAFRFWFRPGLRYDDVGFRFSRGQGAPSPGGGGPGAEPGPRGTSEAGAEPVPRSGPRPSVLLLTDRARARLEPMHRPAWAANIGRDRFGLFTEVEVDGGGVVPVVFRLRWVPPGRFWMGSSPGEPGRSPNESRHLVTLSRGFWLADTPCTQALWVAVMGKNPSRFAGEAHPVEKVSFGDVPRFLAALAKKVPGLYPSLPTEAQWEFACRAGTDEAPALDEAAWHAGNANKRTQPVAEKAANRWGLYDMLGNVGEWCLDGMRSYGDGEATDPTGPMSQGTPRVVRGGAFDRGADAVRAAARDAKRPSTRSRSVGFRLSFDEAMGGLQVDPEPADDKDAGVLGWFRQRLGLIR